MKGEDRYEQQPLAEMKPEPNQKCPRCNSVNTKFCYFNNKKTSQPRYICKNCKRFWTQGRNVPNVSPPLIIVSAGGNVRKVGSLNFTRPQQVANQSQLKFVHRDINSLSITQVGPSFNTAGASHYMEPSNANIFGDNRNQIGHSLDGLSGSSSGAWSDQLSAYIRR